MKQTKTKSPGFLETKWFFPALLVVIGAIFLRNATGGELLNYDDERYIQGNELIQSLDASSVGAMFSTYFDGHYHPITLLSLAVDQQLYADSIKGHHTTNLILHLLNAVLAFLFLYYLFKNRLLAFSVALLFMLHPMNVESYAWMTERKNLLYSAFYLASALCYWSYVKDTRTRMLIWSFVLFTISILSKAQAMTFIPVMFLLDYLSQRNFKSIRLYLEKAPFLLLAIAFVVLTTGAQSEEWGDLNSSGYGTLDKLFLASFAFVSYLFKGIIPLELVAYYPYPSDYGSALNWYVYASILVSLAFPVLLWTTYKSKNQVLFFGLSFFLIHIFLMLKFLDVPFGNYYMANRYNYLPLLGLLLIPVYFLDQWSKKKGYSLLIPIALIAVVFGYQANARIAVWNNSVDLWTDVLDHYPKYSHALNMRALGHIARGNSVEAVQDFTELTTLDPDFGEAYLNLGVLYYRINKPDQALLWTSKALKRFPEDHRFYHLSANIKVKQKDLNAALTDIEQAISKVDSTYPQYHLLKAQILVQMGRTKEAEISLQKAQALPKAQQLMQAIKAQERSQTDPEYMFQQATALAKQGRNQEALGIFNRLLNMQPDHQGALVNRGSTLGTMGNFQEALKDFKHALELNPQEARIHYLLGVTYRDLKNKEEACKFLGQAAQLGWQLDEESKQYCNN